MFDSQHPSYAAAVPDWVIMTDTYAGERAVKAKTFVYLPATSGQIADGALTDPTSIGRKAYDAYLTRAIFPDFVKEAVQTLVGVMHREPAEIQLPAALEPMREKATKRGESLLQLLRRINEQQMLYGRFGLLGDVAPGRPTPHVVTYPAPTVMNWDSSPQSEFGVEDIHFVVLDESGSVRNGFSWGTETRHRALLLGQERILGDEAGPGVAEDGAPFYWTAVEVGGQLTELVVPVFNGRRLAQIPFVIVGANDLDAHPDDIPLLGLANLSLAIYRGEADYRQTLFQQGQATLVIIGGESEAEGDEKKDAPTRVGAGAILHVPMDGDAKYIGAPGEGIAEQRQALTNDKAAAREKGSQLLHPPGSQAESGEALKIRVAATTASLHQIALTGAAGLERMLRICAEWMGADPAQVKVTPNLEFAETPEAPQAVSFLMDAKEKGLPLSESSIHSWLAKNRYTAKTYEQERAELDEEDEKRAEEDRARLEAERAAQPEPRADEDEDVPPAE